MPGAQCTRSLVCDKNKHTSIVTTVTPERPGIPRAMVYAGLFDTVACASYRRLDAGIGASERHDLAVRQQAALVSRAAASTASRPASVTCARPSVGQDGRGYRSDLGPLASEISEFQKISHKAFSSSSLRLDRFLGNRLICLVGQFC